MTKVSTAAREAGAAEPSTALATIPPEVGGPLSFDTLAADMFSTLPKEKRALVVRLMQGAAAALDTVIGKKIQVSDVIAHRINIVDTATGEVKEAVRIVLISPEGDAYQAVSDGVKQSLRTIASIYGKPPWKPALTVEVQQIKTRRGFRTYVLNPIE